jgi:hypothetical protein
MRTRIPLAAVAVGVVASVALAGQASAALPPGYSPLPGSVALNPAQVGAVGSQFAQNCNGLPRPLQPGEVAWHFILPQALQFSPTPTNVFDTLTVTFQNAGMINLSAVTDFGPPDNAHAYVFTPADDTLLAGTATVGRLDSAPLTRANDTHFNLSHTCASPAQPTTTTTTTTVATTTTSATTSSRTAGPATTVATTTTAAVGPATTSQVSSGTTSSGGIPTTGSRQAPAAFAALLAVALGGGMVALTRRRET